MQEEKKWDQKQGEKGNSSSNIRQCQYVMSKMDPFISDKAHILFINMELSHRKQELKELKAVACGVEL